MGARSPAARPANSIASGYPASTWRSTPMPGSQVITRSRQRAASCGAVRHRHLAGVHANSRCPRRRRCAPRPSLRPTAVFSRALRMGQSAMASLAVPHGFGLAIGRSHRAAIQVIASDHDGRFQLAGGHHAVHLQREFARARRSPASRCAPAGPGNWTVLCASESSGSAISLAGNRRQISGVSGGDIRGLARKRHPAERPAAFAEQRPDVLGHEAGNRESVRDAAVRRHAPDVVAVIEGHRAGRFRSSMARTWMAMESSARSTYSRGSRARSSAAVSTV